MNFNSFFRGDNFLFRWCNKIVDTVLLSVLWVFFSLPLVTAGPAAAALYFLTVKHLRENEDGVFLRFWRSFLGSLRTGIPATLISAAALALLSVGLETLRQQASAGVAPAWLYIAYYVAAVVPVGIICWLFPLLGRFSFSLGGLFSTAAKLALRHLPSTVVVVLLTIQAVNFCLNRPMAIFLFPTLAALLSSLFFERIFRKYLPAEKPEEEKADSNE